MGTPRSLFILLVLFLLSPPSFAHRILFYYNSQDGTEGGLTQCVSILQRAGHHVTAVDVKGDSHDPTGDNWGAPYDQVWDMRFVDRDTQGCGNGRPTAADYFDDHWRRKSISFLNHCGKLFVAGEHYTMGDRTEGLYRFLKESGAVKGSYDSCPPSHNGNSTTQGKAFYKVKNGLGPARFYGSFVGGIPVRLLNGTSFVETDQDWEGLDSTTRSIASGWKGSQLGGAVRPPTCGEEKLFMVWDATMWTLWQPGAEEDYAPQGPIWDESGWFNYDPSQPAKGNIEGLQKARVETKKFFIAIARWLGSREDCPCASERAVPAPTTPILPRVIASATPTKPAPQSQLVPNPEVTQTTAGAPATLAFNGPTVNLYMRFLDGPGDYRLDILTTEGKWVRNIYAKSVRTLQEDWATWDGTDAQGRVLGSGVYLAQLSKEGRVLRRLILKKTDR